jgi:hypothetical protein
MKFSLATVTALLLADSMAMAFVLPQSPLASPYRTTTTSTRRYMAMENVPPPAQSASNVPVIQQNSYGQPTDVRYSDFLRLVNADRIEKVTFSSDGTQLLGVDTDGARIKIQALPNDPDLLNELTAHKVRAIWALVFILCRRRCFLLLFWLECPR